MKIDMVAGMELNYKHTKQNPVFWLPFLPGN